jgi:hypothetical protein
MGWGVVVCGVVSFKKRTNEKERTEIIKKIKDTLELPDELPDWGGEAYNEKIDEKKFDFLHTDLDSNIDEEIIENLQKELKGKVEDAMITLYYLDDEVAENFNLEDV